MIPNKKPRKFTISLLLKQTLFVLSAFLLMNSNLSARHLMIYGDSLSAAYGMDENKGWVNLLAEQTKSILQVSNASISGETSAGGLARLPLSLDELSPDLVILELGANDGLRGYSPKLLRKNLDQMIQIIKDSNADIVLASISLPPTYGPRYIDSFRNVFAELAAQHKIPLLDLYQPSFLETPGYIQEDGLHPTEVTQPIIRDLVIDFLKEHDLLENKT